LAGRREIAAKLAEESVTIESKANEEGVLYGSVGVNDIVDHLRGKNYTINSENVIIDGQIKEHGLFTVKVHLHQDVDDVELKVWVVPPTGE
jgi:large subunit ribosomal protein L9